MLRLMATGDNHFRVGARFAECVRVHEWIAAEVARRKPDVFLLTGDLYDADSVPDDRSAAAAFHDAVAAVCPIVEAQGNHGRRRDLRILARQAHGRHPVIVEEAAGVHYVAGAAIAAVAWPERASVEAMVGRPVPTETTDNVARELMRNVLRGLGLQMDGHQGPRILMGHFMVDGSVTTGGQPLIGAELNLGLADLAMARAQVVVMGHIHLPQRWDYMGTPMLYGGSPYRMGYGEPEDKSILYVEIEGDTVRVERIATPARPMHLLAATYADGNLAVAVPATVRDADIRVRYKVTDADRAAGAMAARDLRTSLLAAGAADVKVEADVEVVGRVRAPEVAAAPTVEGQLRARMARRGEGAEKTARQVARLAELTGAG